MASQAPPRGGAGPSLAHARTVSVAAGTGGSTGGCTRAGYTRTPVPTVLLVLDWPEAILDLLGFASSVKYVKSGLILASGLSILLYTSYLGL